jgi:hypothetical protein
MSWIASLGFNSAISWSSRRSEDFFHRSLNKPGSVRTTANEDREHCPGKNMQIKPNGPVTDIVSIVLLLFLDATAAAYRHLPHPGQARTHSSPQFPELWRKLLEMVFGKGTRADQAHLSLHHTPQLWQFINTKATEERADPWNNPWILSKLEMCLPFATQLWICRQKILEPLFSVSVHRAQLPHFNRTPPKPFPLLTEKSWTFAEEFDQEASESNQWQGNR